MKKKIITIAMVLVGLISHAQQETMFTHYTFNTLNVNPAYAGSRDALTVTGLHRSQWVGFKGAPTSQTITLHAPVANKKMGLGFSLLNDRIGSASRQGIFVDVAYRLSLGSGELSFGLKGGLSFYSNRVSELWVQDETDNQFSGDIASGLLPNMGAGIQYKSDKLLLGLSSPKLLKPSIDNSGVLVEVEERHYYGIIGTRLNMNNSKSIVLQPTAWIKYVPGSRTQLDITALFYFKEKFWVGPMFRTNDAAGLLAGISISDQFDLGYSFDWSYANKTAAYNGGSHELMLRYDFIFKNNGSIISPRYF